MFERYTEKARRVIFFARYEASHYGSPCIDSEHLLLGLLREDPLLMIQALGGHGAENEIREAIERGIEPRERTPTSVEVPLSEDSKRILRLAADEAEQLGNRYVNSEHIALGMLMAPDSPAAKILVEKGASLAGFRNQISSGISSGREGWKVRQVDEVTATVNAVLAGIGASKWTELSTYFAPACGFIDASGKCRIGRDEIGRQFEALFLPYAKKGVTFSLEGIHPGGTHLVWANILWQDIRVAGDTSKSTHRMTVLLEEKQRDRGDWQVVLIQVTPLGT